MTSIPPAMGSIFLAVTGWSMATGATRMLGWKKTLHITRRNTSGAGRQRPKRTSTLRHRDIERVQIGRRTGFVHHRSGATDMIRVAVSKYQVP